MTKKPGLQGSLELQVDQDAFGGDEPAHLPDYLDRTLAAPVAGAPRVPPPGVAKSVAKEPQKQPERAAPLEDKVVDIERMRKVKTERRAPKVRRSERRELSIDAETSRMIDRVLADLQEKTPQKDVTASEFARAILQLADESRHHQDFSHVNRRGQWGSPTARAFVLDVKKVFLRAIGRYFIEQHPQEALDFYNEKNAESDESPS